MARRQRIQGRSFTTTQRLIVYIFKQFPEHFFVATRTLNTYDDRLQVSGQQQTLNYIDSAGSDAMSSLSPETSNGEAGSTKQSYWNGRGYDNCEEHFQSNVLYSAKAKTNAHDTCQNTNQIAIVKHETDRFWEELTRAPLVILKHVRTT